MYNPRYYNGFNLINRGPERITSLRHFVLNDNLIVGIFQGNRGGVPELDFIVKFLQPGRRSHIRQPSHIHWIVDLIAKYEIAPVVTTEFVRYFRDQYDVIMPFESIAERNSYDLITPQYVIEHFEGIEHARTYSLEFLSAIIELFIKCEKRTQGAFMFRGLLELMLGYCEGTRDYYQVINQAKRV